MTNSSANQGNVTPIESKQPAPAAKFTITCMLDGFPVAIEAEGNANNLRALVDRLRAIGAEPPVQTPAQAAAEPTKPAGTPVCPDHRTPMKASKKPGAWFCPRRADNGDFCPNKA